MNDDVVVCFGFCDEMSGKSSLELFLSVLAFMHDKKVHWSTSGERNDTGTF